MKLSLQNQAGKISFDSATGSVLSLQKKRNGSSICRSGDAGLWEIGFADGSRLTASEFAPANGIHSFTHRINPSRNRAEFKYRFAPAGSEQPMLVTIRVRALTNFFDFQGEIHSPFKTVLGFSLPGPLQFKPSALNRVICPTDSNDSVGIALLPDFFKRSLHYGVPYPPAFADFFHLDTESGTASLFGIQPPDSELFTPGKIECHGQDSQGYLERTFATFIKPNETWTSPAVRLLIGATDTESIVQYARKNGLTKALSKKVSAAVLDKLKNSVHVKYDGSANEKLNHISRLPSPSLIHFCDYLHGGFDRELPQHLPPHSDFGTTEEMKRFFDEAHARGHLVSPYMNSSWWCEKDGMNPDAFALGLDQKPIGEEYDGRKGWLVSYWNGSAVAKHREIVKQLTQDFPSDLLFEDQFGSRPWHYDLNPASPNPTAYIQGVLNRVREDSRLIPLSTEGGFDQITNSQTLLFGLGFKLVPSENEKSEHVLFKDQFPPSTFRIYPLVQKLCHDKALLLLHNLGQFAGNPESLAWTLALGFSLSFRVDAGDLRFPAFHQWLLWLSRIQKTVCARYLGMPIQKFEHGKNRIQTSYGKNRSDRIELSVSLKRPFDYRIKASGLEADASAIVVSTGKAIQASLYESDRSTVSFDLPKRVPAKKKLPPLILTHPHLGLGTPLSHSAAYRLDSSRKRIVFQLPRIIDGPSAEQSIAPVDWAPSKPKIGILLLDDLTPYYSTVAAADWMSAFQTAHFVRKNSISVEFIRSREELAAALKAGPGKFLTLINPYGEHFPILEGTNWEHTADLIQSYVIRGGTWWETGGYSFYTGFSSSGEKVPVEIQVMQRFEIPVGLEAIDRPSENLGLTQEGREWLGPRLGAEIENTAAVVNRAVLNYEHLPAPITLIRGASLSFVGGYTFNGWGFLWRFGGFNPPAELVKATVVSATRYRFLQPVNRSSCLVANQEPKPRYLWSAEINSSILN